MWQTMSSTSLAPSLLFPLSVPPSLSLSPSLTRLLMTWQPRAYRQATSDLEGLASPTRERRPSSGTNERGNPFIQPSFGMMEERLALSRELMIEATPTQSLDHLRVSYHNHPPSWIQVKNITVVSQVWIVTALSM